MKRFSFGLEKVLEIRDLRRQMAEEDFGRATKRLQVSQARLRDSQKNMERHLIDTKHALSGALDLCLVRDFMIYRDEIKEQISKRSEETRESETLVNEARDELVDRTRASKALQNFKDRQFREYRTAYWKEQGKTLDEIANDQYSRRERR